MNNKTLVCVAIAAGACFGSAKVNGATTTLPLQSESVGTCIYNGSTTQTLETSSGVNPQALPFNGTTAYDFYSPPLTAATSLTTSDKAGGTITMQNTSGSGANNFAVVAAMQFYDYDPTTGTETLIVETDDSGNHNVNHGVTSTWAMPNKYLASDWTVPVGHLLHARLRVTLNSGNPAGFGAVLFNGLTNSTTALLPENRFKTWTFAAPTAPAAITGQPASQTISNGFTATFSVTATGADLGFQWQTSSDNGSSWTNLDGANATSYTTPVATTGDNGRQFRVVVNGTCGPSLISSSATLTVSSAGGSATSQPPAITSLNITPDHSAQLQCAGQPYQVCLVQATTDLAGGQWQIISTNALGADGTCSFTDTAAAQYPSRFYRLMVAF